MKSGIDSTSFWNVFRLTPQVYRKKLGMQWCVKEEFNKLDKEGIKERAEYVLDTTINLFITLDEKRKALKQPNYQQYYIELKSENTALYKKASKNSEILGYTPKGLLKIYVQSKVAGLTTGDSEYWKVAHSIDFTTYLTGFIINDDIN